MSQKQNYLVWDYNGDGEFSADIKITIKLICECITGVSCKSYYL